MGWTCTYYPRGKSFLKFCKEEFEWKNENGSVRILDACLKNFNEGYMAVERTVTKTGERFVFAMVMTITWHRDSYHNICYKEMDETMQPYLYNCPERILKLLTPTDNEEANKWRQRCWERIELNKKINKMFRKIQVGDKLIFNSPIYFTDGYKTKELTVTAKKKSNLRVDNFYIIRKKTLKNYLKSVVCKEGDVITVENN